MQYNKMLSKIKLLTIFLDHNSFGIPPLKTFDGLLLIRKITLSIAPKKCKGKLACRFEGAYIKIDYILRKMYTLLLILFFLHF